MSEIEQAMWDAARDALVHLFEGLLREYLDDIWKARQEGYGPENIGVYGAQGCVIRATDKVMRLKGRYFDGRAAEDEKVEDAWLDLAGYGLIGLVCERGWWPSFHLADILEEMRESTHLSP